MASGCLTIGTELSGTAVVTDGVKTDGVDRRASPSPPSSRSPEEGLRYKLKARAGTIEFLGLGLCHGRGLIYFGALICVLF